MKREGGLSHRERQIMDVLYANREATVTEVLDRMKNAPSRSSVRTFLRILEGKGHVKHKLSGREFIYRPVKPRRQAARTALARVLDTFFSGSIERAVAAHLADRKAHISPEDLKELEDLIRQARKKGG